MARLISLTLAGTLIFAGFGIPFHSPDWRGLVLGAGTIVCGALLLLYVDKRTKNKLEANTAWNRVMKADGKNLVDREPGD